MKLATEIEPVESLDILARKVKHYEGIGRRVPTYEGHTASEDVKRAFSTENIDPDLVEAAIKSTLEGNRVKQV